MILDLLFTVLLVAILLYEFIAIINKRRRDTISERNWDARDYSWWARMLVDTLVIWAAWHLFVDDEFFVRGVSWVDLVVVVLAASLSLWTWHRRPKEFK